MRDPKNASLPSVVYSSTSAQRIADVLEIRNPRKVPVHPELERILTWWFDEGFKIAFRRCPAADDSGATLCNGSAVTVSSCRTGIHALPETVRTRSRAPTRP